MSDIDLIRKHFNIWKAKGYFKAKKEDKHELFTSFDYDPYDRIMSIKLDKFAYTIDEYGGRGEYYSENQQIKTNRYNGQYDDEYGYM